MKPLRHARDGHARAAAALLWKLALQPLLLLLLLLLLLMLVVEVDKGAATIGAAEHELPQRQKSLCVHAHTSVLNNDLHRHAQQRR